ncbi:MAG: YlbF family regulator [Clostridia bacterium]|nr:YlbF family regulator [Clostridia bacterium]
MDIIEKTRELGALIQQDERYLAFVEARKNNEADDELNALITKLGEIQDEYGEAVAGDEELPESEKEKYDKRFRDVYTVVMQNENMLAYQKAKAEIDAMMQYIMQLLSMCVNGADPQTCEVPEQGCTGSCATCGGCG